MVDSPWTTTEVPLQAGTHNTPAKSWAVTDSVVRIANTQHAVLNQIHDLFVKCGLESITDVTWKFLVQENRLLSNRGIKSNCSLNCSSRGLRATHDFNQRDDVWRIERVTNQNSLSVLCVRLHHAWCYAR